MNKAVIYTIVVLALGGFVFWGFQTGLFATIFSGPNPLPQGIILFYGADCPHCKIVEAYISDNKISEKVSFTNLEIPFNGKTSAQLAANAKLLMQVATSCKIDTKNGVSIPFLYDGVSKCLIGDTEVINFFKDAAKI